MRTLACVAAVTQRVKYVVVYLRAKCDARLCANGPKHGAFDQSAKHIKRDFPPTLQIPHAFKPRPIIAYVGNDGLLAPLRCAEFDWILGPITMCPMLHNITYMFNEVRLQRVA